MVYFRQSDGVVNGDVFLSYKSMCQDVRYCTDWIHAYVSEHELRFEGIPFPVGKVYNDVKEFPKVSLKVSKITLEQCS